MKVFQTFGLLFVLLAGRNALCARPDTVSSSTVAGSGYFMESLLVHRHLPVIQGTDESFFSRQRDASDEEADEKMATRKTRPVAFQPSSLSWELGYAFASPSLTSVPTAATSASQPGANSHSLIGGLEWEALPEFEIAIEVSGDSLPDVDYRHGRVSLRFEYYRAVGANAARLAALAKLREGEEENDELDARAYYLNHTDNRSRSQATTHYKGLPRRRGKPLPPPSDDDDDDLDPALAALRRARRQGSYPNLKTALVLNADRQIFDSANFQAINSFEVGPELNYDADIRTRLHLSASYTGYSTSVQSFASQLPVAAATSFVLPGPMLAAFQPRFLAFPTLIFEEGVARDFSETWTGEFYANQVFYALTGTGVAVGLAPLLVFTPARHWSVGAGADLLLGGSATTVVGLLNLSYLF